MRTSFHHQSEAQPPNGPLTAATSPDTPSTCSASQSGLQTYRRLSPEIRAARAYSSGQAASPYTRFRHNAVAIRREPTLPHGQMYQPRKDLFLIKVHCSPNDGAPSFIKRISSKGMTGTRAGDC
jgi:hypothetical protein